MAQQEDSDEFTDDDLSAVDPNEEVTDEDFAAAPQGPTFYVRDTTGVLRPLSADDARRATAMGLKVLSEDDVRALRDAPQKGAPADPSPAKDPGLARTLGRGLLQGFFKQGADEAVGGIARAGTDVGPGARYRMPNGSTRPVETGGDLYRAVRDTEREIERGARENRPVTSFIANMAGDIASDAALNALGVPVASTPYQVASGALSGLLGNDAELSTGTVTPEAARSAAGSALLGGGLGYVMPKVGTAVARALPGAMARLRQALEGAALTRTKKALTSGSRQLASKVPVSDAAAREALDSGAVVPFGTTEGAFERLKDLAETRGKAYADILEELQAAGVEGPQVEALAQRLSTRGDDLWKNSGADKGAANVFTEEAANIRNVAPPAPGSFQIVGEGPMAVTGSRLPPASRAPTASPPPAQAPASVPPQGPMTSPLLTPPPVQKAPTLSPLGGDPTRAGRPKAAQPTPEASAAPGPLERDARGRYLPRGERGAPRSAPEPVVDAPVDVSPPVAPSAVPLREPIQGPMATRLPLSQAERIKRALQERAKYDKAQKTGLDKAKEEAAAYYKEAIEQAVEEGGAAAPPGSPVADLAERFVPTKRQLAATLEARNAAKLGASASAHRMAGGAADVNLFDVANASQASGTRGLPALALAMAGRAWKERRPSTMANVYDVGAEAAGNFGRWFRSNPRAQRAVADYLAPATGRQIASSDEGGRPETWAEREEAQVQRALAEYLMRRQQEGR